MFGFFRKIRKTKSEKILKDINPVDSSRALTGDLGSVLKTILKEKHLTLVDSLFFENIKPVIEEIVKNRIDGDVVNIGIYKGGASLYMKSLFEESGVYKKWWLFDSFSGFREDLMTSERDINCLTEINDALSSLDIDTPTSEGVLKLFQKHDCSKNLQIVEGYIEDVLELQNIESLSFLHIDVDFYDSTYFALKTMYPKLNRGGWVIIDDYNVKSFDCKAAVDKYRTELGINDPIIVLGNYQVGWKKSS